MKAGQRGKPTMNASAVQPLCLIDDHRPGFGHGSVFGMSGTAPGHIGTCVCPGDGCVIHPDGRREAEQAKRTSNTWW
jgi:hypothetical protein